MIGGTRGEQQAIVNYWRQRLAVANARGVAKMIKARAPFCTGDHYPLQEPAGPRHHFSHVQAILVRRITSCLCEPLDKGSFQTCRL